MNEFRARLSRLHPRGWGDIARAYGYLIAAGWRIFGRRERVEQRVFDPGSSAAATPADLATVSRVARWTNTAARYPFPWARCLQRSVALCMWLERLGMQPALRIGVRKSESGKGIDAHAWVEVGGLVVNDKAGVTRIFAAFEPANASIERVGEKSSRPGPEPAEGEARDFEHVERSAR
ncbi:MAG: lasso peptide biosynthesis B2 protein [Chloroflexi bacterium]|nr:lasso peptide biosynthesis B2 protein [Chloroflexota bacterium]